MWPKRAAATAENRARTARWRAEQDELRRRVVTCPLPPPRFVAGVDCAFVDGAFEDGAAPKSASVNGASVKSASVDGASVAGAFVKDAQVQGAFVKRAASERAKASGTADAADPPAGRVFAAAVVWDCSERCCVERVSVDLPLEVPYIPTFLSFREGPAVTAALRKLSHPFGAILFDGQGLAHPRRCGLATHVGVQLDRPSIGVAKSRLIGTHADLPKNAPADVPLMDNAATPSRGHERSPTSRRRHNLAPGAASAETHSPGINGSDDPPENGGSARSPDHPPEQTDGPEQIGIVQRTRSNVRPLYISIGHRCDLPGARAVVLACLTRYRLPEPTRLADIEVALAKKRREP